MHHLLKLVRHRFKLIELLLRHLTIGQHVHYNLLWVSAECVPELVELVHHVCHIPKRCVILWSLVELLPVEQWIHLLLPSLVARQCMPSFPLWSRKVAPA